MSYTKKDVERALIAVNHNTTAIREALAVQGAQHNDILGELKNVNANWFKVFILMIIGIFAIVGVKLGGLI